MGLGDSLAYFVTWTVYGSHLQGDELGWRRRGKGHQPPQPQLTEWHRTRLKHDVWLLSAAQRQAVETSCREHCEHRRWHLWEVNARSTHVHVVVTASESSGKAVRDQLKANCTRGLRERWSEFRDRTVWTRGGDWQCVNDEESLEQVCLYVREAQDRMECR
jgi:REP element-mobilizing transposase RayT